MRDGKKKASPSNGVHYINWGRNNPDETDFASIGSNFSG